MNNNNLSSLLPKEPFFAKKGFLAQFLFLILFVVGGMLIFTAIGLLCSQLIWGKDISDHPTAAYYRLIQMFSAIGTFLAPALLFSFCHSRNWFRYPQAERLPKETKLFLYVIFLAIFLLPLIGFIVHLNQQIHLPKALAGIEQWMQQQQEDNDHILEVILQATDVPTFILNLLICAALPAICEEFFFRGTLQNLFQKWTKNQHIAIWLTGFIFSAIHLQFNGFFARWLLGVYLGYLLWWSGSLWVPIFAHFLHNALSVTMQLLVNQGTIPDEESISFSNQTPAILSSLLLTAAFIALIRYTYQQNKDKQEDISHKINNL